MRRSHVLPALAAVASCAALLAAGCGGSDDAAPAPPTTTPSPGAPQPGPGTGAGVRPGTGDPDAGAQPIAEAIATAGADPVSVQGHVVIDGEGARLCEALLESLPPQCGGASLALAGFGDDAYGPLQAASGVRWSDAEVVLTGRIADGVLTLAPDTRR